MPPTCFLDLNFATTILKDEYDSPWDFTFCADADLNCVRERATERATGLKLKVGKFRAPFGTNNRLHMHDLPWTTRPLVVSKFLGTEHGDFFESGFNPVGEDPILGEFSNKPAGGFAYLQFTASVE